VVAVRYRIIDGCRGCVTIAIDPQPQTIEQPHGYGNIGKPFPKVPAKEEKYATKTLAPV